VRETTLQTPRSVKNTWEEVLQMPEERFSPAAHGADYGEPGCPLQPMEVHGRADLHLQPGEDPMLEQVDA